MLWPLILVTCFGGLFVWAVSRLARDMPMSPQFRKVNRPLLCQLLTDFHNISIVQRFDRLVSVRLGRFMEHSGVLPKPSLLIEKVWVPPIHYKVHWRVGRWLGSCRLISVQPLIGSTIRAFSIGSALCVLEVLCCLYLRSFYQTSHISLWWMVVVVNWLTLCQEFILYTWPSELFSILENKLIGYADDFTLLAVVPST